MSFFINNILTILPIVISLIGFAFSIVSFVKTQKYSSGTQEIYVQNMISTARKELMQLGENNELIKNAAYENFLNAYDVACSLYLNNKIDKKRFHDIYKIEILQLVENDSKKLNKNNFDSITTRFNSVLETYKKWK